MRLALSVCGHGTCQQLSGELLAQAASRGVEENVVAEGTTGVPEAGSAQGAKLAETAGRGHALGMAGRLAQVSVSCWAGPQLTLAGL